MPPTPAARQLVPWQGCGTDAIAVLRRLSGDNELRWSVLILAAWLGACTTSVEEARHNQWEAGNIYPANYRAEILAYLRTYLNDPANVRDAAVSEPTLRPVATGTGNRYVVCLRYAAKRASGGYAGNRDHLVSFVSGKLDRFVEIRGEQARGDQCNSAAYVPFPEAERLTR